MHAKHVVVVADDLHTRAWIEAAIGALDVAIEYCPAADWVRSILRAREVQPTPEPGAAPVEVTTLVEDAAAGSELRLLLVLDHSAFEHLRMPVRCPSDFVARAASSAEVGARVRGLLWPGEEVASEDIIRGDDLTLNLATYQAQVGGVPVEFTYLEYALFAFLVTHPNRVYSREVLLSRVWGTDYFGGARTVDVHVRRVREKLGPETARHLETVRNVGYLWRR
jgi:hypothetical protein